MHLACFGTRRFDGFPQPSSAKSFDETRAHHLLLKYQSTGEDLYNRAVKPNIPQMHQPGVHQAMPSASLSPAMSAYDFDDVTMNQAFAWEWPGIFNMPCPIQVPSVTPKLIIDSIVQLQGLSPVQVENLLREVAAQQGPYED